MHISDPNPHNGLVEAPEKTNLQWAVIAGFCGLSAASFYVHETLPTAHNVGAFCGQLSLLDLSDPNLLRAMFWSPWNILLGWAIMMVAMMTPLIAGRVAAMIAPKCLLPSTLNALSFLGGYFIVWTASGLIFLPIGFLIVISVSQPLSWISILGFAIIWTFICWTTPADTQPCKECPNFLSGIRAGWSSCLRCGPWMIVPMSLAELHLSAMVSVTVLLILIENLQVRYPR